MIKVEIDEGSGFCFGVVTAINKAEEELAKGETLYCLGDIVHNSKEVERLKEMGLITINHDRRIVAECFLRQFVNCWYPV
jgi:4-hydroxy-3-methylbut-2-en-1-yl diphosphate reductase